MDIHPIASRFVEDDPIQRLRDEAHDKFGTLLKARREARRGELIVASFVFLCYLKEMLPPPSASESAGTPGNSRSPPRRSWEIIDHVVSSVRVHSSSAVPFSWERWPGISKTVAAAAGDIGHLVPLPPAPVASHNKRSAPSVSASAAASAAYRDEDPFAVALAECAKRPPGPSIEELFTPSHSAAATRQRPVSTSGWSISDRLGLRAASCKARCAVADSAVYVPRRPGQRGTASLPYALSNRGFG